MDFGPVAERPPAIADHHLEPSSWAVLGRRVSVPVEVRQAGQWSVQYLVPAAAAQRLVGPSGLTVTGPVPGKALMALAVCRYDDTDLDPYHEVAMSFEVRAHDAPPRRRHRPRPGPRHRPRPGHRPR